MKFLHTADWQIGMRAAHAGAASSRVREARVESATRIIDIARNEGAEFLLIAGDTFENNGIDRAMVQKIGDILARFGGPVYVLPGNHDPLDIGSVWEHPVWSSHIDVHVLREARPVKLPSGVLFPCPILGARPASDPTHWIADDDSRTVRIGVAHGAVEGNPLIEPSLPIRRDIATRGRLDYLALGHWHSTATYEDSDGRIRMAYSGTHEATSFRERDSGNVLVVEIAEPGSKAEVRTISTGSLHWESTEMMLIERGQLTELRKRIEAMPLSQPTLIEIRLNGLLFADEAIEITRLEQIMSSRFLFGRVQTSALAPAPADENWVSGLPQGFLRNAGAKLREIGNSDADARRRLVAARALRELYVMKEEVLS
jgi:DNA repair exonuclease SbcCD nuclease subunit